MFLSGLAHDRRLVVASALMRKNFATFSALLFLASQSGAVTLVVDYTYDSGNFFGTNLTAKAALEAAALDISNAITSSLGPVTTDVYTSTNGSTTATFNWNVSFDNPTSGTAENLATFNAAANQITLFAGMRSLPGSTLGVGGPAGAGFSFSGGGQESEWIGAVAGAQSLSNAAMLRGGGPVMGTLSGSSTLGATTANYSLQYGALFGALSLDSDVGTVWHYDHTTAVGVGENDFYSVALHEMLHAIGIGTSETWTSKTSGTNWTGTNVIALTGSGTNMLNAGGDHIAEGTLSTRISDGGAQEAVMDPSITVGTRKSLTALDLAFLQDIGFSTVSSVPEPSRALFLLLGMSIVASSRRRRP